MNSLKKDLLRPHYCVFDGKLPVSAQPCPDGHLRYDFGNMNCSGTMDVFTIFSGIELIYNDFTMSGCDCHLKPTGNLLEINYCHEGREECQWVCGHYLYIGEGDLSITRMSRDNPGLNFPTGRYRGISIVLDLDILKNCPPPLLDSGNVRPEAFGDRFCPDNHFLAIRANHEMNHIFGELYEIPQAFRHDYYKIKVLELLLFLTMLNPDKERRLEQVTKNQIDVVKQVRLRLLENLGENITIEQLAREFCISPTALKASFKMVQGDTIRDFVRKARMDHAAAMLLSTDDAVSKIALSCGYANQSKFASAFKAAYGLAPAQYRRKCSRDVMAPDGIHCYGALPNTQLYPRDVLAPDGIHCTQQHGGK